MEWRVLHAVHVGEWTLPMSGIYLMNFWIYKKLFSVVNCKYVMFLQILMSVSHSDSIFTNIYISQDF